MSDDPTKFDHYVSYPVCGFCMSAWDIIFQRMRALTSPQRFVEWCKVGGCDPDVWDYIDDRSGWPYGWKLIAQPSVPDVPIRVKWKLLPEPPEFDDRVYHKRSPDSKGPNEPWRRTSTQLLKQAQAKAERKRNGDFVIEWDDDEDEDNPDPVDAVETDDADDDGIEWD